MQKPIKYARAAPTMQELAAEEALNEREDNSNESETVEQAANGPEDESFKKRYGDLRRHMQKTTEAKDKAAFIEYEKSIAEKPGGPKVAITKAQDDRITQIQQESQDSGGGYETSPTSNQEDNVSVSSSDFSGFYNKGGLAGKKKTPKPKKMKRGGLASR